MKKILILGGNGYIGSHLSVFLKNAGLFVDVFGGRNSDYNTLTEEFFQPYSHIILLAGHSSVASCNGELKSSWNNNVRNFSNLVQKIGDKKLIYASSASVYGNYGQKIYTENDICLNYINNYDVTKNALDFVARDYISNGYNIIGLRFGTVNGPSSLIRKDLMLNSMVLSAIDTGIININNKNISRPILALKDLSSAVLSIINGIFYSGIYNLASFNTTVDVLSQLVSEKTNAIINDNGNFSAVYDFNINTSLFCSTFKFKFNETPETIINDLIGCYNTKSVVLTKRDIVFHYEG